MFPVDAGTETGGTGGGAGAGEVGTETEGRSEINQKLLEYENLTNAQSIFFTKYILR